MKAFVCIVKAESEGMYLTPGISYSWKSNAYTFWLCWLFWAVGVGIRKGISCKQL